MTLQQGLCHAAPAELLDRSEKQHREHERDHGARALGRKRCEQGPALDERSDHEDDGEPDQDEDPPERCAPPQEQPGQEGLQTAEPRVGQNQRYSGDGGAQVARK